MTSGETVTGVRTPTGALTATPRNEAVEYTLNESLRRMMESVRADAIFGAAVEREGVTIIPCVSVQAGFGAGGGAGAGPTPANQATGAPTNQSVGSGIGGGGGARGRPVATIVLSQGHVRVLPVLDITRLAIAAMTTAGFFAAMIAWRARARS